jgi:hypothetical protein
MITLKEFLETIDYKITEGSEYYWNCFGPNAYSLDHWNGDQEGCALHIVFDKTTQTVYTAEAHDYINRRSYRLINSDFKEVHDNEVTARGIDDVAYDDVNYIDLESAEDWLEKARAIFLGEDYDTRVSIPLDIPKDDLYTYMLAAHERDMSLNEFVEEAIRNAVKELEQDPEGFKQRAERWKHEQNIL